MKSNNVRIIAALAAAALIAGCATTPPPAPSRAMDVSPSLQDLAQYEFGQSHTVLLDVEAMVAEGLNSPGYAKTLARELTALLNSGATLEGKRFACRQLSLIGSEENVSGIAPWLVDEDLGDMARYALQPIPGDQVDDALLKALDQSPNSLKAGLVNSLGMRRCGRAETAIRALAGHRNTAIAGAARAALIRIDR